MPEKWAGVTKVATTTVAADTKARRCAGSAHRCTDGGRWRRNDDDDDDHEQQQQQQQQPAAMSYTGTLHAYCGTRTGMRRSALGFISSSAVAHCHHHISQVKVVEINVAKYDGLKSPQLKRNQYYGFE